MSTPAVSILLPMIPKFEGNIPWMYLDTRGNVTVGIGQMIPSVAAAVAIPFLVDNRLATPYEIGEDFDRVKAMPFGLQYAAGHFRCPSSPTITIDTATAMMSKTLSSVESELSVTFAWYLSLQARWQAAILDMGYNLGMARLKREYPRFLAAAEAGNWQEAMAQCKRIGIGLPRNAWTASMFQPEAA